MNTVSSLLSKETGHRWSQSLWWALVSCFSLGYLNTLNWYISNAAICSCNSITVLPCYSEYLWANLDRLSGHPRNTGQSSPFFSKPPSRLASPIPAHHRSSIHHMLKEPFRWPNPHQIAAEMAAVEYGWVCHFIERYQRSTCNAVKLDGIWICVYLYLYSMICGHPSHRSLLIAHCCSPVLQLEALVATRKKSCLQVTISASDPIQNPKKKSYHLPKKCQKMAWIASPRRPSCGSDPFFGRVASLESFES